MEKFFSTILGALGLGAAGVGSQACMFLWVDEPEMPSSLVK